MTAAIVRPEGRARRDDVSWLHQLAVDIDGPRSGVHPIYATAAVLCPDCAGDWCPSCNWTGLAR